MATARMAAPANRYLVGATAMLACQRDRRFSYCLYVPSGCGRSGVRPSRLMVVVHGSRRMAQQERDAFAGFAEEHGLFVLAPLFPIGVGDPDDTEGYKLIHRHGIRYDEILLAMIEEAAARYPIDRGPFLLHGFSGGGQFAHRFFYLHAQRLLAVSIGAPGAVTLLDDAHPWWVGTGGIAQACGRSPDIEAMRRVSVGLVIGGEDTDPSDVRLFDATSGRAMPGIALAGDNRMQRLRALRDSFHRHGIHPSFDVVPGVAHNAFQVAEPVMRHFGRVLAAHATQGISHA